MRDAVRQRTPDTGQVSGDDRFLNAREAALLLGVSERTIRRAILRGTLSATKRAGVFRIDREDLDRHRQSHAPRRHVAAPPVPLLRELPPSPPPFNVPIPRFPLIGREGDLQAIHGLLACPDVGVVTILGPGGVGKTRLALEVAARVRDAFPDGIWFIELAPVRDPTLVPMVMADHLGLQESAGLATLDRLSIFLESRTALLILDNVEHLLGAIPSIAALVATAPSLKILVTSRVRLNVVEEHRYPLAPLPLPEHDGTSSLATTAVSPAVELFCRKAQLVRPDFRMTPANAPAVEGICIRLDGLPLAIELAAARVNILQPGELLLRLDQSLALLSGGPQDAPRRLRSMRDAIAWSYDLLDPDTQRLFRQLAVFSGGFNEAAAGIVGYGSMDDPPFVFAALSSLVDNNLLTVENGVEGKPRFIMLETVREFGVEQVQRECELTITRDRHAQWCHDLARRAWSHWFTSRQGVWTDCLEQDHENLQDALQWMTDFDDRPGVIELTGLLWPYWFVRSHWRVGLSWIHKALDWSNTSRTVARVRLLIGAGCLYQLLDDHSSAMPFLEEAYTIVEEVGPVSPADSPLIGLSIGASVRGDYALSAHWDRLALTTFRSQADEYPSALPVASVVLGNMAYAAYLASDMARAIELAREAMIIQQSLQFTWGTTGSLFLFARIAYDRGDTSEAANLLRESLLLAAEHRDLLQLVERIETCALIGYESGNVRNSVILLGGCDRLREMLRPTRDPRLRQQRDLIAREAIVILGPEEFHQILEAGRRLSLDDLIAIGLEVVVPVGTATSSGAPPWGLTPREMEVLRFLVAGHTDREIAEALFISPKTVGVHITHILDKLNVPSRAAAVAYTHRHGLT